MGWQDGVWGDALGHGAFELLLVHGNAEDFEELRRLLLRMQPEERLQMHHIARQPIAMVHASEGSEASAAGHRATRARAAWMAAMHGMLLTSSLLPADTAFASTSLCGSASALRPAWI